MNIEKALKSTYLFKEVGSHSVNKIIDEGKIEFFKKKQILFQEGATGRIIFLLLSGTIKVSKSSVDGQEIIIRLVKPGELFAEAILFKDDIYPGTALAVEDSQVFLMYRETIRSLLGNPEFRDEFIKNLMQKVYYLSNRILYLTAYDIEERFCRFILERYGKHNTYEIEISKKDIAAAIGCTPETFSRVIKALSQKKILTWEGKVLGIFWNSWIETGKDILS